MTDTKKWTRERYLLDAPILAPSLLGAVLVHRRPEGCVRCRIVEVEAYGGMSWNGHDDDASHARNGKTKRNAMMYELGGHAYVFRIYGTSCCMNIVTGPAGNPQAVLIRAVEPIDGWDLIERRRPVKGPYAWTNGPGKTCAAMAIGMAENGWDLCGDTLYIEEAKSTEDIVVKTSPRIHIEYAQWGKFFPWRWYIGGNPYVSKVGKQK